MKHPIAIAIRIAVCLAVLSGLSSCRTVKGAGQDMQHLGHKIEREADKHSH